jgi:hypothetical protein
MVTAANASPVGVSQILLTVLGFVVGLGLSFRSSTAYERFAIITLDFGFKLTSLQIQRGTQVLVSAYAGVAESGPRYLDPWRRAPRRGRKEGPSEQDVRKTAFALLS